MRYDAMPMRGLVWLVGWLVDCLLFLIPTYLTSCMN